MAGLVDLHLRATCSIETVASKTNDGTPVYAAAVTEKCRRIDSSQRRMEIRVRGQTLFPKAEYLLKKDSVVVEEALIDGEPCIHRVVDKDGLDQAYQTRAWV